MPTMNSIVMFAYPVDSESTQDAVGLCILSFSSSQRSYYKEVYSNIFEG